MCSLFCSAPIYQLSVFFCPSHQRRMFVFGLVLLWTPPRTFTQTLHRTYSSPMTSLVLNDSSQLRAKSFEMLPDQIISPMASLVLTDSSQLTVDCFKKLPDQITYPYAEPDDLQKNTCLAAVTSDILNLGIYLNADCQKSAVSCQSAPKKPWGYLSSIHKTGCYQRLEGEEGYLDSPNYPAEYPQGLECCYEIARPSSRYCGLMLYAHLFQVLKTVEDGDFCLTDWFAMDSCVPEGGSRLCGNLTGSTFQYLFQPGSRAIRFIFHSSKLKCERTLEYRYQLKYHLLKDCDGLFQEAVHTDIPGETSTPCYTRIADRSGTINTPYHPSVYPNNVDCVYEFVRKGISMR
uniref:CUB domain-containing protein n=1 Tax=Timema poppense TaxID=170557 RepID=A0A7R9GZA9_TIMPO|nr:unnamed protein product [Timema poppensis]